MINESTVNSQVTDSVTQADTLMLGNSASQSMSLIDLVTAETLGMTMHNAVTAQQNSQMSTSASVTASCAKMLQATPPVPPPAPAPTPIIPPPFMPLDPSGDETAADFVKQATKMAEQAINAMKANQNSTQEDEEGLKDLLSKLQTFTQKQQSGGNPATTTSTPAPNTTSTPATSTTGTPPPTTTSNP